MSALRSDPQEPTWKAPRRMSVAEYLEFEREAEFKHELHDGFLIPMEWEARARFEGIPLAAMAGAQLRHVRAAANLMRVVGNQLENSSCEPFASDLRVRINERGSYVYPDVVVACDAEFENTTPQTLLNPVVIIEVLSPSTQKRDREAKLLLYQSLPTLRDYLLVSTDAPRVQHYTRYDESAWLYRTLEGLSAQVALPSIGCTLLLREVYQRITFEEPTP